VRKSAESGANSIRISLSSALLIITQSSLPFAGLHCESDGRSGDQQYKQRT
jgi:hypothetical protein